MRVYTRYKRLRRSRGPGPGFYLLLVLIALLLLARVWWGQRVANEIAMSRQGMPTTSARNGLGTVPGLQTNIARQPKEVRQPVPPAFPAPTQLSLEAAGPWPRQPQNLFEAQVAMIRHGISPGSLDGVFGLQTRAALLAFQEKENLPATGDLDSDTKARLKLDAPPSTIYVLNTNDLARLLPVGTNWLSRSRQPRLDYETVLELVAEKGRAHPNLIRRLNPGINWTNVMSGARITIPNFALPAPFGEVAFIRIRLAARTLEAFDAGTNLQAHFPCSIAQRVDKRPVGELHVVRVARNPNYVFDPNNFPESTEARQLSRKLLLPPGPNNPVGTAWIGLDRPGYGIHGTPRPEEVGRTESHGCFRLANWNADLLSQMVRIGTPVFVEP